MKKALGLIMIAVFCLVMFAGQGSAQIGSKYKLPTTTLPEAMRPADTEQLIEPAAEIPPESMQKFVRPKTVLEERLQFVRPKTVLYVTLYEFKEKWNASANASRLAVDSSGNLYVACHDNYVRKYSPEWDLLASWDTNGDIGGIVVDPTDSYVYVALQDSHKIKRFETNGTFSLEWGGPGSGDGKFENPRAMDVDSAGNVYVVDLNHDRIQKFDPEGSFLTKWEVAPDLPRFDVYIKDIAVRGNSVYLINDVNTIYKYDTAGNYELEWEIISGGFPLPATRIAIDSDGNVYVQISGMHQPIGYRIVKCSSTGKLENWNIILQENLPNAVYPYGMVFDRAFENLYMIGLDVWSGGGEPPPGTPSHVYRFVQKRTRLIRTLER
ncbi:MAG: hypothetical protein U9R38_07970 [Candidatus Margulisiibacteriota bacterium]|nr:hypothetical protein [Candidatus Margulisiibacteriota bacterium]